jgi:hypothetical protein
MEDEFSDLKMEKSQRNPPLLESGDNTGNPSMTTII